jgi:hypothetical protein
VSESVLIPPPGDSDRLRVDPGLDWAHRRSRWPMMARLQIGEVLLPTSIGDVLREFHVAIVLGNAALPD